MKKIIVLDGSVHGAGGNTRGLVNEFLKHMPGFDIDMIELKNIADASTLERQLRAAHGFIVASGTYWQSWGSPMQRFLEQATPWEATDIWIGKPICTLVTMHSVGGAEVAARLQSNFNLFGCLVPPMCSIIYAQITQIACENGPVETDDIWGLECLPDVAHNFRAALNGTHDYKAWKVDTTDDAHKIWFKK